MSNPNAPTHSIQPGFVTNEVPAQPGANAVTKIVPNTSGQAIVFHTSSNEPVSAWLPTEPTFAQFTRIAFQPEPDKEFHGRSIDVLARENGHLDLLFLVSEQVDGSETRRRLFVANDIKPVTDPATWTTVFQDQMQEITLPDDVDAAWVKWSVRVEPGQQRSFMLNGTPTGPSGGFWYWSRSQGTGQAYVFGNMDGVINNDHIVTPGALASSQPQHGVTEGFYVARKLNFGIERVEFVSVLPGTTQPFDTASFQVHGPETGFWRSLADLIVDTDPVRAVQEGTTLFVTTVDTGGEAGPVYRLTPDAQLAQIPPLSFTDPAQRLDGLQEISTGVRFGSFVTSGAGASHAEWLFDTVVVAASGERAIRQRRRDFGQAHAIPSLAISDVRTDDDWATCVCVGPDQAPDVAHVVVTGADGRMALHVHDHTSDQWQRHEVVDAQADPMVYIEARTELMPNHLPGKHKKTASSASLSKMVPSSDGLSVIFHTTDSQHEPISVWLPTDKTFSNHSRIVFRREPDRLLSGISLDAIERKNGNIDLIFLVAEYVNGVYTRQRLFVTNDFTPVQDPEAWILLFEVEMKEIDLPSGSFSRYVKWSVRVEGTNKRDFLLYGNPTEPQGVRFYWCGPDPSSQDYVMQSMDSIVGNGYIVALGALPTELPSVGGFYVGRDHGNGFSKLDFYTVKRNPNHVGGNPYITQRWPIHGPIYGLWPRINNLVVDASQASITETGTTLLVATLTAEGRTGPVYRLDPYEQLGQGTPASFTDPEQHIPGIREITSSPRFGAYVVTGEGNNRVEWMFDAAEVEGAGDFVIRLRSRSAGKTFATPFLLAGGLQQNDDWATCVCTNPDLGTDVVHVVATDRDGSVTLFFQDGISELWQQRTLIETDLSDQVEIQSYTTNINIYDSTWAPLGAHRLAITSEYPTSILVNGRSFHTSSVLPVEVSTSAQGTLEIISPVQHLGVPKFSLHPVTEDALERANSGDLADLAVAVVPDFEEFAVDPNQVLIDRMKQYDSGHSIEVATKSNGQPLFPDGPPSDDTCATAAKYLQDVVDAHKELASIDPAVLAWDHRRPYTEPVAVVKRTVYRLGADGNWTFSEHDGSEPVTLGGQPLAAFAGVGDGTIWSAIGDVLNYLWEGIKQGIKAIDFAIHVLEDGVHQLVITIGGIIYNAALKFASAIADAADWVLQHTLGISLEDLRQWLGFIFNWGDIVENHKVLKNLIDLSISHNINKISYLQGEFSDRKQKFYDDYVKPLTYPTSSDTDSLISKPPTHGHKDDTPLGAANRAPNAQFGTQKTTSYAGNSSPVKTSDPFSADLFDGFKDIGTEATKLVKENLDHLNPESWSSKSFEEIVRGFAGLAVKDMFDVGAASIEETLNIAETFLTEFKMLIDHRIEIPVLTPLYENILVPHGTLTMLDAVCLIAAIGGTIACKLATGNDLFTQEERDGIGDAKDYKALIDWFKETYPGASQEDNYGMTRTFAYVQIPLAVISIAGAAVYALNYIHRYVDPEMENRDELRMIGGVLQIISTLGFTIAFWVLIDMKIAASTDTFLATYSILWILKIALAGLDMYSATRDFYNHTTGFSLSGWEAIIGLFATVATIITMVFAYNIDVPGGSKNEAGYRAIQTFGMFTALLLSLSQMLEAIPILFAVSHPQIAKYSYFARAVLNLARIVLTVITVGTQVGVATEGKPIPGVLAD